MQLKYRITLGYTLIVLVLLLTGCGLLYYYAYTKHLSEFDNKLKTHAKNISSLYSTPGSKDALIKMLNKALAGDLNDLSILVQYGKDSTVYTLNEDATQPLYPDKQIITKLHKGIPSFFNTDIRHAVAYKGTNGYTVVLAAGNEQNETWIKTIRNMMIIGIACFVLIFFITGYLFSKRVVRSISRLTEKLTRISSEAFSARLSTGKEKDELWELATTVNNLLDRLQSSFDTQRRFLSNASHELTTPLAAISSQLDVALHKERSNEEYKKVFLSVKDDVKRLALLVRSILEIAKASGSVGGIDLTKVRIDELLMRIPGEMKKISQLYDVKLSFEDFPESEGFDILYGNEALLYSALRNIIHNACKFSKDKCAKVSLTYTFQNIVVEVKDNGPGIPPNELETIFQPFFRGFKYENTNMIHGTGLGLALAHRIIELHKGDIYVESVVGEGSTFSIFLPVDSTKTYKK